MSNMYHEKQRERKCVLHAVNNALQKKEFSCKDMERAAHDYAAQIASRVRGGRKVDIDELVRREFIGSGGFYSPDLAIRLLTECGYSVTIRKTRPRKSEMGSYLLVGTSHNRGHSIAIAKGYVIDSEEPHPIRLPATAYFRDTFSIGAIYSIREAPSTRETQTPVFLDLTAD